jgi:hypothetical protein
VGDQLDKEIAELKGFIADLKADRAAQKEKEKKEAWTKYTSMSLVFVAVLAAIATQWAGKYSSRVLVNLNDATYNQAQASDQWSYYQAKSIKQNLYEALKEMTPAKPASGSDTNGAAVSVSAAFTAKIAKYETEKSEIKAKAEKLEQDRNQDRQAATLASQHGGGMGSAVSVFQIAIALGSICLVTKKRSLWYVSMVLAGIGAALMIRVWLT